MFSKQFKLDSELTNEFLGELHCWNSSDCNLSLFVRRFDVSLFTPTLFEFYGIPCPDGIKRSIDKRQSEFLAGRICARDALLMSGFTKADVPTIHIGSNRSPIWPQGYTGSITHTSSIAACVIAKSTQFNYLGLDIERIIPTSCLMDIASMVCNSTEWNRFTVSGLSKAEFITVIFSAKEALFKATYPKVLQYFDFDRATLTAWDSDSKTIKLELCNSFAQQHQLPSSFLINYALFNREAITLLSVKK